MAYLKNTQYRDGESLPIRCLVYSTRNHRWAPVAKVNRRNDVPEEKGTYQLMAVGDIVVINNDGNVRVEQVTAIWDTIESSSLSNIETTAVIDTEQTPLGGLMLTYTDEVFLWLLGDDIDDNLPAGVGWDGKRSMYEVRKRSRLQSILWDIPDELFKQSLLSCAQTSPFKDVPIDWEDAVLINNTSELGWSAEDGTVLIFVAEWDKDFNVTLTKFDEVEAGKQYTKKILGSTHKAVAGTIYRREPSSGMSTKWELYRR